MKDIYIKNIKKTFLLFMMLLLLLPCASAQAVGALDLLFDTPVETTLYFENYMREMISVAVCYYDSWEYTWVCEGWVNVPPGQVNSCTFSSSNGYGYIYAQDSSGYALTDPETDEKIIVISEAFSYDVDTESPVGTNKRAVYFETVELPYGYTDYYELTIRFSD